MTAAQKAARANFKKAVAEAKKIRKKNPKLSQAQAVKQAWAIIKGKRSKVGDFSRSGTKVKDETGAKRFKKPDYKVKRTSAGTFVKWAKVGAVKKVAKKKAASKKISTHKDTRSHNVNIRVVSGMPKYQDKEAAREIQLFADNDAQLYYSKRKPIIINLQRKYKKGTYDINKAAKLWRYYIDAAMQKYSKEYGSRGDKWHKLLSVSDRNLLALDYAMEAKKEFDKGEFLD